MEAAMVKFEIKEKDGFCTWTIEAYGQTMSGGGEMGFGDALKQVIDDVQGMKAETEALMALDQVADDSRRRAGSNRRGRRP